MIYLDKLLKLKGLMLTKEVIDDMYNYNTNLKLGGCFYCNWENRKVNINSFDYLKAFLNDKLLDVKIRKHKSIPEISYTHTPLTLYDKNGKATLDYIELTKQILKIVGG